MTIKRILLLGLTLFVSLTCVIVMNFHYDVLSRYTYEISDEDADKLRNYLTYREINYLIDYSISADYFIDYIEADGFNVYHFPFYNRIRELIGDYYSNNNIVYYAERALKENINEDEFINYIGMGYQLDTIVRFYDQNAGLFKKETLAIDPLNYDFTFKNNETVFDLVPYDLVSVDYLNNSNEKYLRSRVSEQLQRALAEIDNNTSYSVFGSVYVTRAFETYDQINYKRKTGDKYLTAGANYYQLGRMFTLSCSDKYAESFFEEFNEIISKYGFVVNNQELNEYLYIGN